jgi:hypothetical protein
MAHTSDKKFMKGMTSKGKRAFEAKDEKSDEKLRKDVLKKPGDKKSKGKK